jgi:predicted flavoprotein YhiN
VNIKGVQTGLLREFAAESLTDPTRLAHAIKALTIPLTAARPIAESISTAGGVRFESLNEGLMVTSQPGLFCAGEMLDWEAPTGGYLLTACFASGRVAGQGALAWVNR